jgi:hypothetical protein
MDNRVGGGRVWFLLICCVGVVFWGTRLGAQAVEENPAIEEPVEKPIKGDLSGSSSMAMTGTGSAGVLKPCEKLHLLPQIDGPNPAAEV